MFTPLDFDPVYFFQFRWLAVARFQRDGVEFSQEAK